MRPLSVFSVFFFQFLKTNRSHKQYTKVVRNRARFPGVSAREAYVSSQDMLTFKRPLCDLNYKFIMFVFLANKANQ